MSDESEVQRLCLELDLNEAEASLSQSQSAGFDQRPFDGCQVGWRQGTKTFFKSNRWQRADAWHIGDGFGVEKREMAKRQFQFAAAILLGDVALDGAISGEHTLSFTREGGVVVCRHEHHKNCSREAS